jgi:small subunit ribosomal protein S16
VRRPKSAPAGDYTSAPGVWQNVSVTPGSGDALSCSLALGHPGPTVPVPTRYVRCPNPSFWEKTTPVAVKIKLKRMGKIHAPYYRIIVADARTKRDGRAIEEIGKYHPKAEPSFIEVDSARAQHWLSVGAQPTDPVRKILEITGDWQKFKGLPGTEGTLKIAEPKANKKDLFASVVAETLGAGAASQKAKARRPGARGADGDQAEAGAGTAKAGAGRPGKTASAAKADAKADTAKAGAKADTAKADATKADAKADGAKADTAKADTAKADAKADGAKADTAKADAKADTAKADAKADTAKADTAKTKAKVDTAEADAAQAAGSADADTSEAGAAEAAAESDSGA